jgi:hypothetical protein
MANVVKTGSNSNPIYTITDNENNTATLTVTSAVTGNTIVFTSSGGLHYDGQAAMSNLLLQLQTGLLP